MSAYKNDSKENASAEVAFAGNDHLDSKENASVEVAIAGNDHLGVHLPKSLQHLSDEERDALARRGKRKIDIMLIPCLTVLYFLNFLDRQSESSRMPMPVGSL